MYYEFLFLLLINSSIYSLYLLYKLGINSLKEFKDYFNANIVLYVNHQSEIEDKLNDQFAIISDSIITKLPYGHFDKASANKIIVVYDGTLKLFIYDGVDWNNFIGSNNIEERFKDNISDGLTWYDAMKRDKRKIISDLLGKHKSLTTVLANESDFYPNKIRTEDDKVAILEAMDKGMGSLLEKRKEETNIKCDWENKLIDDENPHHNSKCIYRNKESQPYLPDVTFLDMDGLEKDPRA